MPDAPELNTLLHKLNQLLQRQAEFGREIEELRKEIIQLKAKAGIENAADRMHTAPLELPEPILVSHPDNQHPFAPKPAPIRQAPVQNKARFQGATEKFIGENIISKIGIGITVVGVGIGAKYAIDNDLISTTLRVILGYLSGLILLFFAFRLKKKYADFSAVLFSGAMAICFLMTYFAQSFYGLFSLTVGMVVMVFITVVTVWGALQYNRQFIAHMGLVGAYAVPFLLGDDEGEATTLFAYIAIINTGILYTAFRRYWKSLNYVAFGLSWLIFVFWYIVDYAKPQDFTSYFVFATVFFGIFYLTFLAYKLLKKEEFGWPDILLLLANAFIFYSLGYALLLDLPHGASYVGGYTLLQAGIHAAAGAMVFRNGLSDPALLRFLFGLAISFLVLAIPVQLDGNWVTILWAAGATTLATVGIRQNKSFYFLLSLPLLLLAFGSLVDDWTQMFYTYQGTESSERIPLFLHTYFLTSWIVIIGWGWISYLLWKKVDFKLPFSESGILQAIVTAVFLFVVYTTFQVELGTYWRQLYLDSNMAISGASERVRPVYDPAIRLLGQLWAINYTLLFLTLLAFANLRLFRNSSLAKGSFLLHILGLLLFLTQGLYLLSELRVLYLDGGSTITSYRTIYIRYISYLFFAGLLGVTYAYIRSGLLKWDVSTAFDVGFHVAILWILSSELIHWQDLAQAASAYKIGLSILWGTYALLLIILGIYQRKKYLRFAAIGLFALTLIKLIFYDLTNLNTLSKTVVLVSLGALLLMISFLYNRYASVIESGTKEEE